MDLEISGRRALVLGAGSGLGRAIARALAREGATVVCAGRRMEPLEQTVSEIERRGGRASVEVWDLANLEAGQRAIDSIETRHGAVEILVNNTGGPRPGQLAGQSSSDWLEYFQSMVLSVISLTNRVLPAMRLAQWGRIVTSTSSGVVAPIPALGSSNSLRLALVGWSKSLSAEVAGDGVTVNVTIPGRFDTERVKRLDESRASRDGQTVNEVAAASRASIPTGRYGLAEEYASVVAFLCSERASYVTGSQVRVDGGMIPSI